jgi:UDP-N-acetylglucosamine--N-acetylmuramyl-(pentapeptide) pyrophosphoryl-undecaprenol N-acetylglucosamine transferase
LERTALARAGFPLYPVSAGPIKGRRLPHRLASVAKLGIGVFQSIRALAGFRPHLVLGVGGYASAPVVTAARLMGIPTALHEQNRLPGMTNRMLARLADRVYLSFEASVQHFPADKCRITGNPVRRSFLTRTAESPTRVLDRFTVLVVGGSQGAHRINLAVLEALEELPEPHRYHFVHQTGQADVDRVERVYRQRGIQARVAPFFDEMATVTAEADVVLCRAGATTVAELTVLGKPAVFVPFPFAADDHQVRNAQSLVRAGAAEMILEKDLSGSGLAERLESLRGRPERLARMGERSKRLGRPDAAEAIVDDCCRMALGKDRRKGSGPETA